MPLRMKVERLTNRWTQMVPSSRAKLTQGEYSRIESGRLKPTDKQMQRLSRVFKLAPAVLLTHVDDAAD